MNALRAALATGASTVSRAWIVRRADGLVLGFTDHDRDLEVDAVLCVAATGLTGGEISRSTGLAVDNAEAMGALSSDAIRAEDIRAGKWDAAEVTAYLVDWTDSSAFEILFRGNLGEISWGDGAFSAELRGLSERLNEVQGRVFQSRCDAVLGDGRCGVVLGPLFAVEVALTETGEAGVLAVPELRDYAPKWFERGLVTVLNGPAEGQSERIKLDRIRAGRRELTLWSALRAVPVAGDLLRIEAGCDKRRETCRFKFDNLTNFRGFPHVPGEDWLMAYPNADRANDGGRR
ncbi:DUF2163 domain-containing protein [Jannaschia ovalis]|uniref:DUF2163 domain-containing protein n=1 Tax=Jannaschia ovalis TaxID=3038773 RepID=A0ABY8LAR1_9RHOB|nr:DUF2163 domain-containing protein [Jannaschia sp. GRR-S6-38]WGH78364.1 DUF2163 domain-containing protein [Jannaschia sp. GRR-S6-38]